MDKVTGFGANVMVGSRSGVATRLCNVHCVNHRLALGAAQSLD